MKQLNKLSKNRLNTVESYAACMCAVSVICSCACSCICNCSGLSEAYTAARDSISGAKNAQSSNGPSGSMSYQRQHS